MRFSLQTLIVVMLLGGPALAWSWWNWRIALVIFLPTVAPMLLFACCFSISVFIGDLVSVLAALASSIIGNGRKD